MHHTRHTTEEVKFRLESRTGFVDRFKDRMHGNMDWQLQEQDAPFQCEHGRFVVAIRAACSHHRSECEWSWGWGLFVAFSVTLF